jgi:hypothetical protein
MPKADRHPVPIPTTAAEAVAAAHHLAGAVDGIRMIEEFGRYSRLLVVQQIKEFDAYKALGHTWDSFCTERLRQSRRTVDEDLQNLELFGHEFLEATDRLSIGRRTLRTLRSLPADELPRLLPGGRMEIAGEVYPVDAEHSEAIAEAVKALAGQLNYTQNRLEDAESAVEEVRGQLAEKEQEAEGLRNKLAEKRTVEREQDRYAHLQAAATGEIGRGILLVASILAELGQRCEREIPDREEVLRAARVLPPLVSNLLDFGAGRRKFGVPPEVEDQLDQDALDEVVRELATADEGGDA